MKWKPVSSRYDGCVYFARVGNNGHVKIGWTSDLENRIRGLQSMHYDELILLQSINQPPYMEYLYLKYFEPDKLRGEWYRFNEEMRTIWIPDIRATYVDFEPPIPPISERPWGTGFAIF